MDRRDNLPTTHGQRHGRLRPVVEVDSDPDTNLHCNFGRLRNRCGRQTKSLHQSQGNGVDFRRRQGLQLTGDGNWQSQESTCGLPTAPGSFFPAIGTAITKSTWRTRTVPDWFNSPTTTTTTTTPPGHPTDDRPIPDPGRQDRQADGRWHEGGSLTTGAVVAVHR